MLDDRPPDLAIPDDEELDDESIAYDSSPACNSGSEGENGDDIWYDHPSLENEPAPPPSTQNMPIVETDSAPVPKAPNIPVEKETTVEEAGPA